MALSPCLANFGGSQPGTKVPVRDDYDKQFANAYAKPDGIGITEMMKMSESQLVKVEALLAEGKYKEAGQIVASFSGRTAMTIKQMPKTEYNLARANYRKCAGGTAVNWL